MVNVDDFNNTKSLVISILKSYNLNDQKINEMVTDEFIQGFLTLEQHEPENNQFLNLARNFSTETNLNDIETLEKSFRNEIISGGYFCDVLQYVVDSWKNIDLSQTPLLRSVAEDIGKGKIAGGVALGLAGVPPSARAILGATASYAQIAVGAYEQEEKVQNILDRMDAELWAVATGAHNLMETGAIIKSPLVIDLDGDGIETVSSDKGVYFDHDGNNIAERSGWVSKDDGLLVRDINGNGQIDNGTELFGDNTILSNGQKAQNGFEALKDLDSNNDGVFNNLDSTWNQVKVWKDSNKNGIVDNGELLSLEQAGVDHFNLNYINSNLQDENGNIIGEVGTYGKADGTKGNLSDVWFKTDGFDSIDRTDVDIPADIAALPNVTGFGNVHDLHTAMALDTTGELKALVAQFASETDSEARRQILLNIIYHWTGVQDMDPNGRDPTQIYGKVIDDTRKLEALEEFMGEEYLGTWCWGDRDPNPHGQAAPYILRAFEILADYINKELLIQTRYNDFFENIKLTWNEQSEKWDVDVSVVVQQLQLLYNENAANGSAVLKEFDQIIRGLNLDNIRDIISAFQNHGSMTGNEFEQELAEFGFIKGTSGDDTLHGSFGADDLSGLGGNDNLYGNGGDDILNGGAGDDNLFGDDGDDILIGGAGNDTLVGGNGADTYIFNPGFGHDSLDNTQDESAPNEDVVQFGSGIDPARIVMERQGYDLIMRVSYAPDEEGNTRAEDSLRIFSYFDKSGTGSSTVSAITFADGTSWNYEYVTDHYNSVPDVFGGFTLEGNEKSNSLSGGEANDVLIGHGGDDWLDGRGGNDVLIGGKGNDILYGGAGDDSYIYNLGDGLDTILDYGNHDKICFGNGIKPEDLTYRIENYHDLRIIIKGDETQGILIQDFNSDLQYKIEDIYFADGSRIRLSEVPLTYHQLNSSERIYLSHNGDTVYAAGGNDQIYGGDGNDTIYGEGGDDSISGGYGDDKLYGGSGRDRIDGYGGNNTIIGGLGCDDLSSGTGDDTYVWNLGDGFDTITDQGGTDRIKFGEGIRFSDLTFRHHSVNDLIITVKGDQTQGLHIIGHGGHMMIEKLEFADGSIVDLTRTGLIYNQTDLGETQISGTAYNDVIYAAGGDDTVSSWDGDDILIGGKGNDTLHGGLGNDTYVWNLGDGFDTIVDYEGTNTVEFGAGITLSDLSFCRKGADWIIYVKGDPTQGMLFSGTTPHLIKFADGSTFDPVNSGVTYTLTDNAENITVGNGDDIIYGNGGNDIIDAGAGNDILIGGLGDDDLRGDAGDDTYIWNLGDGFDSISDYQGVNTLKFGEAITREDLTFVQNSGNLDIYVKNDRSQGVRNLGMFVNGGRSSIDIIEFADGTVMNLHTEKLEFAEQLGVDINNRYNPIAEMVGSNGADQLVNETNYGTVINGKGGNDYLRSGSGDDIYIYNLGDGFDTISDWGGANILRFGEGISLADLTFRLGENGQFNIYVDKNKTQGVSAGRYTFASLEFADGSSYDMTGFNYQFSQGGGDDYIRLKGVMQDYKIDLGAGNDRLEKDYGNNTVCGGKGNDILTMGSGDDTYIYNRGDGFDYIHDTGGINQINFGEGISFNDLSFRAEGSDLIILVNGNESQGMKISGYFSNQLEWSGLKFADGSFYDLSVKGLTLNQTNGSDSFTATYKDDIIYGNGGHDSIYAGEGNDTLIGGTGNDNLYGGNGDDTYIYNLGDGFDIISDTGGNDKIVFGPNISQSDLSFERIGNNLRISLNGDEIQGIQINNHFSYDDNKVEAIKFHDGTTLDISNADQLIQAMNSFSLSNSVSTDILSSPAQDVSDMYNLAANTALSKAA